SSHSAGCTCGATSMNSRQLALRRSQVRRSSTLPYSMRSRRRSAAAARRSAVSCGSKKAGHWPMPSRPGCAPSKLSSAKRSSSPTPSVTLSRWQGLTRFIDDGLIELDNNTVERSIGGIKLSRKNALFAGSDEGAIYYSSVDCLINQEHFDANHEATDA